MQHTDRSSLIASTFQVVVSGESMWPVLIPGRHYTAHSNAEPVIGDIVVAQHPNDASTTIIKRLTAITHLQTQVPHYHLESTVSWGSTFTVSRQQILGVINL